jgi:hypothetical protein
MFTSFLSAVLFAIAHHVLNLNLDGKEVTELAVGQQWISRSGNALAYVVKVLLVLATGTAYFQRVWHHARGKPTKLSQFDSLFGVQESILEFRHVIFWFRRPILLLAALILWWVSSFLEICCAKPAFKLDDYANSGKAHPSVSHNHTRHAVCGACVCFRAEERVCSTARIRKIFLRRSSAGR